MANIAKLSKMAEVGRAKKERDGPLCLKSAVLSLRRQSQRRKGNVPG